jgi:hypothetical protein
MSRVSRKNTPNVASPEAYLQREVCEAAPSGTGQTSVDARTRCSSARMAGRVITTVTAW